MNIIAILNMETVFFSEMFVSAYESTRRQNLERKHRRHGSGNSNCGLLTFKSARNTVPT
jgi:hypothetical protein